MINYLVINLEEGCQKSSFMFCVIWKNDIIGFYIGLFLLFECV